MGTMILIIIGLFLFEIVSSLDNAVVNADVLTTVSPRARRWFLVWGILFSVFLVRGLLPWLIIFLSNPSVGFLNSFMVTFSDDPSVKESLERSAPMLLMGGGIFLVLLFLHWIFLEPKEFGLAIEKHISRQGVWFFALASILLTTIIWQAMKISNMLAFAASVGGTVFFIVHGFKEQAAKVELEMKNNKGLSDVSKLIYLEVLDTTFSIDGVIGAFAFTFSVPLIILGNGLGAIVVRELTIRGVDKIRKYPYLKNGAMYSIFFLGLLMVYEGFGHHLPEYLSPVVTIFVIAYFFVKSLKAAKQKLA